MNAKEYIRPFKQKFETMRTELPTQETRLTELDQKITELKLQTSQKQNEERAASSKVEEIDKLIRAEEHKMLNLIKLMQYHPSQRDDSALPSNTSEEVKVGGEHTVEEVI